MPGEQGLAPPDVIEWVRSRLDDGHDRLVGSAAADPRVRNGVLYCHATPRNDEDIFTERTPEERIAPLFADVEQDTIVCGHTHMQFDRMIAGKRVVNSGSVGMSYDEPPRRVLDARPRAALHAVRARRRRLAVRVAAASRDEALAFFDLPSEPDLVPIGRVGRPHGLDGSFFVEGPSDRADAFAKGATVYVDGEPVKIVALEARLAGPAGDPARARASSGARRSPCRARRCRRSSADEYYAFQLVGLAVEEEGGRLARARPRGARLPCERRARARLGPVPPARGEPACGRWTSRVGESLLRQALQTPNENRRLHTRPPRLRVADRAAADRRRARHRARAAADQLSRHDAAASGAGRRRAVRRRRRNGPARRRRRDGARSGLRRRAAAPRDRAHPARAPAHAGDRRGAGAGGAR